MQNPSILDIIFGHLNCRGIKSVSLVCRYELEKY